MQSEGANFIPIVDDKIDFFPSAFVKNASSVSDDESSFLFFRVYTNVENKSRPRYRPRCKLVLSSGIETPDDVVLPRK
jgi:hypothetical protein